jgi:hypothetical protein
MYLSEPNSSHPLLNGRQPVRDRPQRSCESPMEARRWLWKVHVGAALFGNSLLGIRDEKIAQRHVDGEHH